MNAAVSAASVATPPCVRLSAHSSAFQPVARNSRRRRTHQSQSPPPPCRGVRRVRDERNVGRPDRHRFRDRLGDYHYSTREAPPRHPSRARWPIPLHRAERFADRATWSRRIDLAAPRQSGGRHRRRGRARADASQDSKRSVGSGADLGQPRRHTPVRRQRRCGKGERARDRGRPDPRGARRRRRTRGRHNQPRRPVRVRHVRRRQSGVGDRYGSQQGHQAIYRRGTTTGFGVCSRRFAGVRHRGERRHRDGCRHVVAYGGRDHPINRREHQAHGPRGLAGRPANLCHDRPGGTVVSIDAKTNTPTGTVAVGTRPWGIAISPDGARLYTANGPSNDVSVVDTATLTVVTTIQAGDRPWGVAVVGTR